MNSSVQSLSPDYTNTDSTLETLVELKFMVERQISALQDTAETAKSYALFNGMTSLSTSPELNIHTLFAIYNNNVEMFGDVFLEKQLELLKKLDSLLLKKCPHNWIDDVIDEPRGSRRWHYCSKCFVRKT